MIPQANITGWQQVVPWSDDAQVEQDLVLSRATCELFLSSALVGKIAMRGGTALHKLVLVESFRYSEDIDLVQINAKAIGGNELKHRVLDVKNPWFSGSAEIATFDNNELMATRLRALYQRRKGRDLFDLWLCLDHQLVEPSKVVLGFLEYMQREGHSVSRAEFEANLHGKESDDAFMSDIGPLLRPGIEYFPVTAMDRVRSTIVSLLPGEPWRGCV